MAERRREVATTIGVAFNAVLDDKIVSSYEVDDDLTRAGSNLAFSGWADECNHWVLRTCDDAGSEAGC